MELMRCAAIPPERDGLPLAFHRALLPANTLFNSTNTNISTNTNTEKGGWLLPVAIHLICKHTFQFYNFPLDKYISNFWGGNM